RPPPRSTATGGASPTVARLVRHRSPPPAGLLKACPNHPPSKQQDSLDLWQLPPTPHQVELRELGIGDRRVEVLARDAEVLDEPLEDELHQERALIVVARLRVLEDEVRQAFHGLQRPEVLGERRVVGEDDLRLS